MCTVNIRVDENLLRDIMPELNTTDAISLWVQQLVDAHIHQMRALPDCDMTQEKLWHAIEQAPELQLKPSEIVDDGGEAVDLETFRADLHKMIEEVYAEP